MKLVSRSEIHSDDKYFPEAYKVYMNLIWLSGGVGQGASDEAGSIDYKPTDTQMQVLEVIEKELASAKAGFDKLHGDRHPGVQQGDGGEGPAISDLQIEIADEDARVAGLSQRVEASTAAISRSRRSASHPSSSAAIARASRATISAPGCPSAPSSLRRIDDVGERAGHLGANRVDDFGADVGPAGHERHAPVAALGHQPDDGGGAIAVDGVEVPDDRRRQLQADGARGLDRQRLVIGDAGARQDRACRCRSGASSAPRRFAAAAAARAPTARAVVYFTPMTLIAPGRAVARVIEDLRTRRAARRVRRCPVCAGTMPAMDERDVGARQLRARGRRRSRRR